MSEADESYDGAIKRAHRAEAKVRELETALETATNQNVKYQARITELERWKAAIATALPHTQRAMLLEATRDSKTEARE